MPPKSKGSALHSLLIWRVWTKKIRSAKQCQSVVRQAGKVGMMCELDGVTGWDFDFRGHKLHGDWQAALGVTLSRVAEMGYENVQITPPAFANADELAKFLKSKGLKADSAICTVYKIPENIEQIARDAEALETNVLRTDSISPEDRKTEGGYHKFAKHLNNCGKLLRGKGLDFMYHFHSFEFIDFGGVRGIDILLKETDPEYVMFQPDVFWLTAAGTEPSRSLEMFRGRARYIHCKDYVISGSKDPTLEKITNASAPVGTGNLHWNEIFKTAKSMGITNFVVEDDMGVLDPFESAAVSLLNLRKIDK
jgi:sugar phosphate isomerase/epimerase